MAETRGERIGAARKRRVDPQKRAAARRPRRWRVDAVWEFDGGLDGGAAVAPAGPRYTRNNTSSCALNTRRIIVSG